ncbi:DUF1801 domain-containing protein [Aquimarina algiphila]|uniref:DUF1801 domain-containing protein n=1 Tax=Aquimarina algiphila TaxID=2047982 RepID=A0A554VHU7_9FLAO|nr:DUF1801 domain-containing protein [Aquimarina algiphila]TSE07103.1 DUF1801 domain-containing protein [Aquimarina algiphila]
MNKNREIHPDFLYFLALKEPDLIDLFKDVRNYILSIYPDSNELLYHTHALTTVYSISEKLSDAFCMIPIYTNHLNLGFNKGVLIDDPHALLTGTGKLIRHIPITEKGDYQNDDVENLVKSAINFAINDMNKPSKSSGKTISKIKKQLPRND